MLRSGQKSHRSGALFINVILRVVNPETIVVGLVEWMWPDN